MEDMLRTAMARVITPSEFIDRPIAIILFMMIVIAVAFQTWTVVRARNAGRNEMSDA